MTKKILLVRLKNFALITVGSLMFAAGVSLFLEPNSLAPGGVSGLAIIISELTGMYTAGVWTFVFNVPILILGIYKFGAKFLISTVYAVIISSGAMNLLSIYVGSLTDDLLLACVAGAILVAAGLGLVFRAGATTGGSDVIVKLLRLKFRHVDTGTTFLLFDGLVVILSGIVFGSVNLALYSGIAVILQTFVLNRVLYGSDEARLIYIISEKKNEIAKRLLEELDTGATFLDGKGAYTGNEKQVLMCVLKMRSLPKARDIVADEDSNAFMVVTSATSVFGEGFKSHDQKDL